MKFSFQTSINVLWWDRNSSSQKTQHCWQTLQKYACPTSTASDVTPQAWTHKPMLKIFPFKSRHQSAANTARAETFFINEAWSDCKRDFSATSSLRDHKFVLWKFSVMQFPQKFKRFLFPLSLVFTSFTQVQELSSSSRVFLLNRWTS